MEEDPLFEALQDWDTDTPSKTLKLIKNGTDVNLKGESGQTFLHLIAEKYTEDCFDAPCLVPVVFQLSNAGINKNETDEQGDTSLHIIARKTRVQKLFRALIMIGVDPTIKNKNDETAKDLVKPSDTEMALCCSLLYPGLWQAATKGDDDLARRLLDSWCNHEDIRDGKPLMNQVYVHLTEASHVIFEKATPTIKMVYAALARDKKALKRALKEPKLDINATNATHIGSAGRAFFMPIVGEVALLYGARCVLKLLKKGANINYIVDEMGFNEPLFLYLMRELPPTEDAYDVLEDLLPYADFSLVEDKMSSVCSIAFENQFPLVLVKIMISKGCNLFNRDANGLTLRDKIFLSNYNEEESVLRKNLGFVDQVLVDMAVAGDIETLESLSLDCYDYDQVVSRMGQTMIDVVMDKGNMEMVRFLEGLPELQRTIRRIHVAIETGNLNQVKEHITKRLAGSRDKGGHGLLHKAVLYERRYIIKYLIKEFPHLVNMRDSYGRTPLHWATCLPDGKDIEDSLQKAGADYNIADKKGKTPNDYRKVQTTMQELVKKERHSEYGLEVYLLQRYVEFKYAIEDGNLKKVEDIRNGMYKDISLNDLHTKMFKTTPPAKDLLSLCLDYEQDQIGKYLMSQGLEGDIKYKDKEGNTMSAEKAADKKGMTQTAEAIRYQKTRAAEEQKILSKVKKEKKELLEKKKKDGTYEPIDIAKLSQTLKLGDNNDFYKMKDKSETKPEKLQVTSVEKRVLPPEVSSVEKRETNPIVTPVETRAVTPAVSPVEKATPTPTADNRTPTPLTPVPKENNNETNSNGLANGTQPTSPNANSQVESVIYGQKSKSCVLS